MNRRYLESPEKRQYDQLAFLPAALEIQETPPSLIGRAIIWTLVVLFTLAVLWAAFGKIDIVAVATGKVIPSDRVKTIQPLEIGTVVGIHIEEGQVVQKGQPLITLDGTQTGADEKRMGEELHSAQSEWLRAQAFQAALQNGLAANDALQWVQSSMQGLSIALQPQEVTFQARLLEAQYNEYLSRRKSLQGQFRAREGERRQSLSLKRKLERTFPLITERADSVKTLYHKKLVSREQHLALEQERIEKEQDLIAESARVDELTGEMDAIEDQIVTLESEYKRNNLMIGRAHV